MSTRRACPSCCLGAKGHCNTFNQPVTDGSAGSQWISAARSYDIWIAHKDLFLNPKAVSTDVKLVVVVVDNTTSKTSLQSQEGPILCHFTCLLLGNGWHIPAHSGLGNEQGGLPALFELSKSTDLLRDHMNTGPGFA